MLQVRKVTPKEYSQVERLKEYSFGRHYTGKYLEDFRYWTSESNVIGVFLSDNTADEGGELASMLFVLPLKNVWHGSIVNQGGIAFVSTYPEHRGKSIAGKVIRRSLKEMNDNGQIISILGPFSVPFYRYFGWEVFFDKVLYDIPLEAYPNPSDLHSDVSLCIKRVKLSEITDSDMQAVATLYNKSVQNTQCMMIRDSAWWNRLKLREDNSYFVLVRNEKGELSGYVRYIISELEINVCEMVVEEYPLATKQSVKDALWSFLFAHRSNVWNIKGQTHTKDFFEIGWQNPNLIKKEMQKADMLRIVNMQKALLGIDFSSLESNILYLGITDDFAPWNTGVYKISSNNVIQCSENEGKENIDANDILSLPINLASSFLSGYLPLDTALSLSGTHLSDSAKSLWGALSKSWQTPQFYEHY
jgi:predicted acetyltransferase